MAVESKEKTFTSFSSTQAAAYARNRRDAYPEPLYSIISDYVHATNNSPMPASSSFTNTSHVRPGVDLLLDIGCGPGNVIFDTIGSWRRAIGVDPSEKMIEAARTEAESLELPQASSARFEVRGAEDCAAVLSERDMGQVDLVTVAMAAHWFDMDEFYASVAKVLKPGGTLAMFTCSSGYAHPGDPKHAELQRILSHLEDDILGPYETTGDRISRNAYVDLALPWTLQHPNRSFSQSSFFRKDWDLNGIPSSSPNADGSPGSFLRPEEISPDDLKGLNSASMVVRWREANREKVGKGEVRDCVEETVYDLKEVLRDRPGGKFQHASSTTLLLMRKVE